MTFLRDCVTLVDAFRASSEERVVELCRLPDVEPPSSLSHPGPWTDRCTASPISTYRTMMRVIGKTKSMNVESWSRMRASDSHSAGTVQISESCRGLPLRGSLR